MFKSDKPVSIWVPLQKAEWDWLGSIAVNGDGTKWVVIAARPFPGRLPIIKPPDIVGADTLVFPEWDQVVKKVPLP